MTNTLGRRLTLAALATAIAFSLAMLLWFARPAASGTNDLPTAWPTAGAAAIADGERSWFSPGADDMVPIGTLALLVTTLVVLAETPLTVDAPGERVVFDADDDVFASEARQVDPAALTVQAGTVMNEHTLLSAMLMTGSGNLARTLVTSVFGDEARFLEAAAAWLDSQQINGVTMADATGASAATRGSARAMLTIAELAAANPVIAEIAETHAIVLQIDRTSPARTITNSTALSGPNDLHGLIAGHTPGGGFALAATSGDASTQQLTTVVLSERSQADAESTAVRLFAELRR